MHVRYVLTQLSFFLKIKESIIRNMLKPLSVIEFDPANVSISSPRIQIFGNSCHL